MAKGTITDDLWRNEKTMRTDLAVVGLAAICWSWSNDNRTDGFVPGEVALTLARGDKRLLKTATLRGWLDKAEGGEEPGYMIHNWDKGNRNRPPEWWDKHYAGKATSGRDGGNAAVKSGGLDRPRVNGQFTKQSPKQVLGENIQADPSTSLGKPPKQPKPVTPLPRTSYLENTTGVDVSLVGVTKVENGAFSTPRLFVKVHRWALLGHVLDSQDKEVDKVLTEAISDDDWLLGADVIQDIIVDCLNGLTAKQRHGKTLINLVRLITYDNSKGKGRSDGEPYPLASILGRAIEDYDPRWPEGVRPASQEQTP